MKKPKDRGTAVDSARVAHWVADFPGYRQEVTPDRINEWIGQFAAPDRDIAARVLDCVAFVAHQAIEEAFKKSLAKLDGWSTAKAKRKGRWRFVPFSKAPGESGDTMVHRWRAATGTAGNNFNGLYKYKSDLLTEDLGPEDTVVFLDDFAGTGTQACRGWREIMEELLPGGPRVYLILVAVTQFAKRRISTETPMQVVSHIKLGDDDDIFSTSCKHFTGEERNTLLRYCRRASKQYPRGWGDCGLVIVLAHKTPNNSIPILHARNHRWVGLFPRH